MHILSLFSVVALAGGMVFASTNSVSALNVVDQEKVHLSKARLSKRGRHFRDYLASDYQARGPPQPPSALPALPALPGLPALPVLALPQLPTLPAAPVPALPKAPIPNLGGKSGGGEDDEEDED